MVFRVTRVLILAGLIGCTGGEIDEKKWYKGNLHTHSMWSDGDDFPEMIMDWYKSNGYHFVALSDHNVLAEGEKWRTITGNERYEAAFEKYQARYDSSWIKSRLDSIGRVEVKLKSLPEYRTLFEEPDRFLVIQSEEISDGYDKKPIHINVTNVQELVEPQGGNSIAEVMQRNIDKVLEQREATGVPMFPHINHPNFIWAITPEDLMTLDGERFFEVYNGHPLVNNYGDSLRPGMEVLWDLVNTSYLKDEKPLLYGLAVDDSHHYHEFDGSRSNPGRGWVMVHTVALTPESIIEAMESGGFYATTGVELEEIEFDGNTLKVTVVPEDNVGYTVQFYGSREGSDANGELFSEKKGVSGSYLLRPGDLFVRAKIISTKLKENPYQAGDTEMAWTQPVTPPND